jgi:hypothetical protein
VRFIRPDGKPGKKDLARRAWKRWKKEHGFKIQLKQLRKVSASLLDEEAEFARCVLYFLGQSPRSVADKHYKEPSDEQFFKALRWLGEQYGLA